mmetsp:Transcript_90268/g.274025  ORF Transcript_90268/g.274025 Transcript_90268/m.274025 type:complete len:230 (-) Transcript_90268:247-936(-)
MMSVCANPKLQSPPRAAARMASGNGEAAAATTYAGSYACSEKTSDSGGILLRWDSSLADVTPRFENVSGVTKRSKPVLPRGVACGCEAPNVPSKPPPSVSEAIMEPALRAASLTLVLRALIGELKCDRQTSVLFIVGGVVLWVNGSLLVEMVPQGGLGIVVVPSCGTVPYVGTFLAPRGLAVAQGTPATCSLKDGCVSRQGSFRRMDVSLSKAVFRKSMSCRSDGTWPP